MVSGMSLFWMIDCMDMFYCSPFSGDGWMYPYQRTPMGNPYISPIFRGYLWVSYPQESQGWINTMGTRTLGVHGTPVLVPWFQNWNSDLVHQKPWGFGAFESKRNCLRDRWGNQESVVVVFLAVLLLVEDWRPERMCFASGLVLEILDSGKNLGKRRRWRDMSDEGGCEMCFFFRFLFSDLVQNWFYLQQITPRTCSLYNLYVLDMLSIE